MKNIIKKFIAWIKYVFSRLKKPINKTEENTTNDTNFLVVDLLIQTTIKDYLDLLRSGKDQMKLKEINDILNSKIQNFTGGFDLHLFQLQKDYLFIFAKSLIAMLEFDEEKRQRYLNRAEELKKEIDRKTAQKDKEETDPYKSFLEWLLVLKKYYGSDIDQSNDLLYLVSATEQMMKFYENQKQQIENQKAK